MDKRLKRNVLFMAVDAVVTIVASLVQLSLITRGYDPLIVGDYQLVQAWVYLIVALSCAGGIGLIATRDLATTEPAHQSAILSNAVALQAVIGLVILAILLMTLQPFGVTHGISLPLFAASVVALTTSVAQLSQGLLVSAERISLVASVSVVANVLGTLLVALAVSLNASTTLLILATVSHQVIRAGLVTWFARSWQCVTLAALNAREMRRLVRQAFPVLIMIIATHLYVRIDIILLNYWTDKESVARYGAAYAFLDQLMVLSHFMMGAVFPNFARASVEMGREYRALYRGILVLFGTYLVPVAIGIALFSRTLLEGVYGPEYGVAAPALSILMVAAVVAWTNGPVGTIFISLGRQQIYMWATLISLVVNIAGNIALIPFIGAIGSAIATVLTEVALCLFCLIWVHRVTGYLPWRRVE